METIKQAILGFALIFSLAFGYLYHAEKGIFDNQTATVLSTDPSSVFTTSIKIPAPPKNIQLQSLSSTEVLLSWDNVKGASYYRVSATLGSDTIWRQLAVVSGKINSYKHTRLAPDTTYLYKIESCNSLGCSSNSVDGKTLSTKTHSLGTAGVVSRFSGTTCSEAGDGEVLYFNPNKTTSGSGTLSDPFTKLSLAIREGVLLGFVQNGATLCLLSGNHGQISISNLHFQEPLIVMAEEGEDVKIESVDINKSSNIEMEGFSVSPYFGNPYVTLSQGDAMIHVSGDSSQNITLRNLDIFSMPWQVVSTWQVNDWDTKVSDGIFIRKEVLGDILIDNVKISSVARGIKLNGERVVVKNSVINSFTKDGIRVDGEYLTIENNIIKNAVKIPDDGVHQDIIQTFRRSDSEGVTIKNNLLFQKASDHPYPALAPATVQGIGNFDGRSVNWTVEGNVVVVNHPAHGISLHGGAINSRIINNTIYDATGKARIRVPGQNSSGNIIANNLIFNSGFAIEVEGLSNVVSRNIAVPPSFGSLYLVNPLANDFHLLIGSPAIDVGDITYSPFYDFDGDSRPQNQTVDVGADEWVL